MARDSAEENLPDRDLAYLVEVTDEFEAYLFELCWAQRFAALNREEMMDRVIDAVGRFLDAEVQIESDINCHHKYTAVDEHFGRRLWVSRKGAIHAGAGVPGLILGRWAPRRTWWLARAMRIR